jgi:ABC-type multidrug transport system fused ATPase/permease subunit
MLGALVVAAIGIGALRALTRVLVEALSQDYVQELRLALVRTVFQRGMTTSLGVIMTRVSNDLTSVRNWVALGIAPLIVGIPMILGCAVALALLSPALALGLLVPVAALLVALRLLAPPTFTRTRELRRSRGRLSAYVADTVLAEVAVRTAGGADRELSRIDRYAQELIGTAVARARLAGLLRGAAAATTALATACLLWIGTASHLAPATLAGALSILAISATPIHDLGRVIEYRQTYLAAAVNIAPALTTADDRRPRHRRDPDGSGSLVVHGLKTPDGHRLPDLTARPGDRILLDGLDRLTTSAVLQRLAGASTAGGRVLIDGTEADWRDGRRTRTLVGYAAHGMHLGRGPLGRTVSYRVPDASREAEDAVLARVGLTDVVAALPRGIRTNLRHGGDPLPLPDRARLALARAVLGDPPVLVLDHLDADLDRDGRRMLRSVVADYPGVVVAASEHPEDVVPGARLWAVPTPSSSGVGPV